MASSASARDSCHDIHHLPSEPSQLSTLCALCQKIFRGRYITNPKLGADGPEPFPQSIKELEQSAQGGCHLCYLRWHDLDAKEKLILADCEKVTYGFWTFSSSTGLAFSHFPHHQSQPRSVTKSLVVYVANDMADFPSKKSPCAIDRSTGNQQNFAQARNWVETCLESHTLCQKQSPLPESRILPTRLIKLGELSCLEPRLCITESIPVTTRYMTLSHCWGDHVPLRLLTSTMATFLDKIELSELPKTFLDAMITAVSVGIHYIWIDSLCIIQDSNDDWMKEAATMADVYQNSWCNIAAAAGPDSFHGCFTQRSASDVLPCRVMAEWDDRPKQMHLLMSFYTWDKSVTSTKLNTRGWIVQENLLSPRVLYFARHQLLWECLELRACETYPAGLPTLAVKKMSLDVQSIRQGHHVAQSLEFDRYKLWESIVDHYLTCELTKPEKDRLVAISGVARKLIVDQDQYLAGLWRKILWHQMMWYVPSHIKNGDLSRIPNMPTWSWACLKRPVRTRVPKQSDKTKRIVAIMLKAGIEMLGDSFSGSVKQGWLRCAGSLMKTTYHKRNDQQSLNRIEWIGSNHEEWLGKTSARLYFDREPPADGSTVYCFTIQVDVSNESKCGLLLERKKDAKGHYFRTGYFEIGPHQRWAEEHEKEGEFDDVRDIDDGGAYIKEFKELCKSPTLEEDEYEGPKGFGLQDLGKTGFTHQAYMFAIL